MTAQKLYESISNIIVESNCGIFEAVGVLEALKADLLTAAIEGEGEEEEGSGDEEEGE
jgi:hypothetical protein